MTATTSALPGADAWEDCGCLLCGAPRERAVEAHAFPAASYWRCNDCGMVYLSPRLRESAMLELYRAESYYAGGHDVGYDAYEGDEATYRRTFERRLRELAPFKTSGRLLDIGCGTGLFVDVAAGKGFEAHGLDVSDYGASVAARQRRGEIRTGTLATVDYPRGHFDVVTMLDLFEHVYDPFAFTARLAHVTADDGIVAIATPDYGSWMRKLLGTRTVSFKIPEHIAYYTRQTLARATGEHFRIERTLPIGQYCSPRFLRQRLAALAAPLGWLYGATLGWTGWHPHVPSGSLLAILRKR